jgi:hypothetical protein
MVAEYKFEAWGQDEVRQGLEARAGKCIFVHKGACRVDQGDRSPRPPTDPDVRDYRIRLL